MLTMLQRADAEDLLFHEAELLETWRLDAWLGLFLPDATYEIPSLDDPDGDVASSQFFVADDAELLAARVKRLKSRNAHAENPASMTHRMISNVRVAPGADGCTEVSATFVVHRLRNDQVDAFPGWYRHQVVVTPDGPRFRRRRVLIAAERLRQGRLSFVL